MIGDLEAAAVHHQLGTRGHAIGDVAGDLVQVRAGHQRAHVQATLGARTDLEFLDLRYQAGDQRIGDLITDADRHRDGHAALAARAVGGTHQGIDGVAQVGVRHDHRVVLGAAQGLDALALGRAAGIDVLGDGGGANEAQRLDLGGVDQAVHGFLVAMHHVQYPLGQPSFFEQLGDGQGGTGVALAGLEDEGIAAGDGQRIHPQRHHGREVEGGDAGHHAQGLEVGPGVDAGTSIGVVLALEQLGGGSGVFDVLDAATQFAGGVFQGLAVLLADQLDQALFVALQQLLEAEQHLGALGRRGVAPGRKGGLSGIDGLLQGGGIGQGHFADHRAGGGVVDRRTTAATVDQLAADEMLETHEGTPCTRGWRSPGERQKREISRGG